MQYGRRETIVKSSLAISNARYTVCRGVALEPLGTGVHAVHIDCHELVDVTRSVAASAVPEMIVTSWASAVAY